MERRDYLMEQMKVFARALGKVLGNALGLRNEGQISGGIDSVHQYLQEKLEIDPGVMLAMSEDEFNNFLRENPLFQAESLEQLGNTLEFLGDSYDLLNNRPMALQCYKKAIIAHEMGAKKRNALAIAQHLSINSLKMKIDG